MNRLGILAICASLGAAMGAGCGDPAPRNQPQRDLTISFNDDFSVRADLAPPGDLTTEPDLTDTSGFCAGTNVEGTCAQAFFAPVARCFRPTGNCTQAQAANTFDACWASGAHLSARVDEVKMSTHGTWYSGKAVCMEGEVTGGGGGKPTFTLTLAGKTLVYDESTGAVTCPDGSKTNIGANDADCPALKDILNPDIRACTDGACP